ncbi:hypothetical protein VAE151_620012 [Vibrio aestuarianus]|nr:hypothetical protein VAE128_490027 [Vibrio aestuarianus]CAH8218468.1 hypothetical protein VAE115_360028 [Vibrio aestuarianus]CAH8228208.1 hypothetical protein VAE016_400028 [Vibrio aestuarianus]CAH8229687.1 hypothetical protein VAE151_620012 [Vibrio aestuarianus]
MGIPLKLFVMSVVKTTKKCLGAPCIQDFLVVDAPLLTP